MHYGQTALMTRKHGLTEPLSDRPTKKRTAGTAQAVQTDNTSEGPIGDGQENVSKTEFTVMPCDYFPVHSKFSVH